MSYRTPLRGRPPRTLSLLLRQSLASPIPFPPRISRFTHTPSPMSKRRNFTGRRSTAFARNRRRAMSLARSRNTRRFLHQNFRKIYPNPRTGGFLGIELKFLDTVWNGRVIAVSTDGASGELQPTSGPANCISVPAQGTGESERDGRKYTIKSAWFSGVVTTTGTAGQALAIDVSGYFFAMVLDTQANAATITSENVYRNPGDVGTNMLPQPLRNLQFSKRYRILDRQYVPVGGMYSLNDAAGTGSFSAMTAPKVSLSWRGNILCDSVGTTSDVTSASDNAIHILAYAGQGQLTPVFRGKSRVRFVG